MECFVYKVTQSSSKRRGNHGSLSTKRGTILGVVPESSSVPDARTEHAEVYRAYGQLRYMRPLLTKSGSPEGLEATLGQALSTRRISM